MFKDIVKASRSYRGYDESYRFRREELEDFVDCARFAPSSVNAQPFRYYLAWEKEEVDRIQKLTNWARALLRCSFHIRENARPDLSSSVRI